MLLANLIAKKDIIYSIAEKYGASNIHVFGSVARRENTNTSDFDLLVDSTITTIELAVGTVNRKLSNFYCKCDIIGLNIIME